MELNEYQEKAQECGYTLEDVAQMNYEKLHSRAERGKIGGSGDRR